MVVGGFRRESGEKERASERASERARERERSLLTINKSLMVGKYNALRDRERERERERERALLGTSRTGGLGRRPRTNSARSENRYFNGLLN
jgi:hypothetical protein